MSARLEFLGAVGSFGEVSGRSRAGARRAGRARLDWLGEVTTFDECFAIPECNDCWNRQWPVAQDSCKDQVVLSFWGGDVATCEESEVRQLTRDNCFPNFGGTGKRHSPDSCKSSEGVKSAQRILGVTADGIWGPKTQAAFEQFEGDLKDIVQCTGDFPQVKSSGGGGGGPPPATASTGGGGGALALLLLLVGGVGLVAASS